MAVKFGFVINEKTSQGKWSQSLLAAANLRLHYAGSICNDGAGLPYRRQTHDGIARIVRIYSGRIGAAIGLRGRGVSSVSGASPKKCFQTAAYNCA